MFLDIKAKTLTGEKFNIEVQLLNQKNMVPRTLFYWSKLFVEDFELGSAYKSLQKTITINILGFKLEELRNEYFHSTYKIHETQCIDRVIRNPFHRISQIRENYS